MKIADTSTEIDMDRVKQFVVDHKEALRIAKEMDACMELCEFTVRKRSRVVAVKHGDGSYLEFCSACFRKLSNEWFLVFTEHHGVHVYHSDDVDWIKEWLRPKVLYFNVFP